MKKKLMGKWFSLFLACAMIVSLLGDSGVSAAKAPKISKNSLTLTVGKTSTVTIKNKPAAAKVTWKSSNKKIASVKNGRIKGLKKGKTVITAKVVYKNKKGKKKTTKTLRTKVTVLAKKSTATKAPVISKAPATSVVPVQTAAASPVPSKVPAVSDIPVASNVPSAAPAVSDTPETPATAVPTAVATATPIPTPTLAPELTKTNLGEEHTSANGITTRDNGLMRKDLSALKLTPAMGLGWNIGNSLEQTSAKSCTSLSDEKQAALTDEQWVTGYETNADNVVSSQTLFDGLKTYGINTVRIPVAWSNMMKTIKQDDGTNYYKINDAYFNRVEEVMNYCLNNEMYVIINIHWDNGWWGMFGDKDETVRQEAMKKYTDMWEQICDRYQEYSDRLIFEGGNEELGERLNDDWKGGSVQTGTLSEEETYQLTNEINQKFVDIVRNSGINEDGSKNNNFYRMLLIPGYDTNLHQTCGDKYSNKAKEKNDKLTYTMPEDKEENGTRRLFVSIHYYDPLGWGIAKSASSSYETPKGTSNFKDTWGSDEDYAAMQEDFDAVNEAFIEKGYGVIFGEFGVLSTNKDGIPEYFEQFFRSCQKYGAVPVMWDEGTYVDRSGKMNKKLAYFKYNDIGQIFTKLTGATPTLSVNASKLVTITGKPKNPVNDNQDPLVVATWDGDFMRNTTTSESVDFDWIKATFGDKFLGNYNNSIVGGYWNPGTTTINSDSKYAGITLETSCSKEWWHAHYQLSDWSKLEKPCVRISVHDDDISKAADLQLVYTDPSIIENENGAAWCYETDLEQVVYATDENGKILKDEKKRAIVKRDENGNMVLADTAWIGKTLTLNKDALETYPVLIITTNDYLGVDFVKVEICDAAYNADGTPFTSESAK